jgi:GNAT superfamily N-acetyltransferase
VHRIELLGVCALDRVEPLWLAMVAHHRSVTDLRVRAPEETWRRRRAEYSGWLQRGDGFILAAVPEGGGEPDGYAAVRVHEATSPTFDLGERVGDLESLAVAERARGAGIGTQLIGAARERLRTQGVRHWVVSVIDENPDARRLYEREGFRPFFSSLVAPID